MSNWPPDFPPDLPPLDPDPLEPLADEGDNLDDSRPMQPIAPSQRRSYGSSRRGMATPRARQPISASFEPEESPLETSEAILEAKPAAESLSEAISPEPSEERPYRPYQRELDPLVAYMLLIALAIGISPLDALVRYTLLWTLMGILSAMAFLLGGVARLREAKIDDLFWGILFGFLASFPFLLAFGAELDTVSFRMFDVEGVPQLVMDTWAYLAVTFAIPIVESLFFRGAMQGVRSLMLTTGLATLWAAALFFPHMELAGSEAIAVILLIVFSLLNFLYSYVRFRNGLAAAWLCQVVSYTMLWFFPRLLF